VRSLFLSASTLLPQVKLSLFFLYSSFTMLHSQGTRCVLDLYVFDGADIPPAHDLLQVIMDRPAASFFPIPPTITQADEPVPLSLPPPFPQATSLLSHVPSTPGSLTSSPAALPALTRLSGGSQLPLAVQRTSIGSASGLNTAPASGAGPPATGASPPTGSGSEVVIAWPGMPSGLGVRRIGGARAFVIDLEMRFADRQRDPEA